MTRIIVAPFYAPRPHPLHVYDFADCLRVQQASCKVFGCEQIVITDAGLPLRELRPLAGLKAFRADLPQELMPATLAGQLAYLESSSFSADTLLTDADTILGRDPREVFDYGGFDLAVTTHAAFSDSILNNGAIFVPLHAREKVIPIWRHALETCSNEWGADQRALRDAVQAQAEPGTVERNGVKIRFLPCVGYNWAPEHVNDRIDSLVIHFRGPRKKWMRAWAEHGEAE